MDIIHFAVVPRILMPPTMMLTIVVAFLVALLVAGVVMNDLAIVYDAARQTQHQRTQAEGGECGRSD
jgi:hypothetical protein